MALAYGGGADADDLAQIAVARVLDRLESFRGDAGFYTWVDRVTVNCVRDHQRRRKLVLLGDVETSGAGDAEALGRHAARPAAERPDERWERAELMERLAAHFAGIKPRLRMPLVLALVHGYTVPEIAAMLEISFAAAKKRLQRGRRELLARVKRDPALREILGGRIPKGETR